MCCQRYVEADVLGCLLGDEEDIVEAIRRLYQNHVYGIRGRVWNTIRRQFPGLSSDQLMECWENSLVALARMARDEELTERTKLKQLLLVIMRRRAIDVLRILQRRRAREIAGGDAVEELPCTRCRDGDRLVFEEMLADMVDAANQLIARQRQAWLAFIRLGLEATQAELAAELSAVTGSRWTGKQARKALEHGRPKIQEYMRRRGYGREFPKND